MAENSGSCALVMHSDCGLHDTGWGHPEHQGRLPAVIRSIERNTPALLPCISMHEANPATQSALLRVHAPHHIALVRRLVEDSAATGELATIDGDTMISGASWRAAVAAAGCAVDAATLVASGKARTAFALCRPPGHHATNDRIMGFCLFNNIAVAARAVQQESGIGRVLIVDWDVHHGNGTQEIFWQDPSVYYLSLHQFPWYPGTGLPEERGAGPGLGTVRNVPVAAETPRKTYLNCFRDALDATFEEFSPELVLISAGYDCMAGDPLGQLLLEPEDLHWMTRLLLERMDGRLVLALEGGYEPARLGDGVVATLRALCDLEPAD
jgi:acetoin utilization deacetylase AcuC-like enzyme